MTTLLHIDSSIQGERSVTCELTKAIVDDLRSKRPDLQVHYLNLATKPLTHLTLDLLPSDHPLAGAGVGGPDDPHGRLAGEEALDEFLAADVVVIGAPMYNFTVPTQLKAWVDRILIAGRTFRYSSAGPEGLMGGKRVRILRRGDPSGTSRTCPQLSGCCVRRHRDHAPVHRRGGRAPWSRAAPNGAQRRL
jgi:FMN-dependent NADH-azoreductase